MKCVECLKQMHSEIRQGVTLDVCPSCFGTWFDYDEINNYLEAHPENRVATQDRDAESLFVRSVEETQDVCPKCGYRRKRTPIPKLCGHLVIGTEREPELMKCPH